MKLSQLVPRTAEVVTGGTVSITFKEPTGINFFTVDAVTGPSGSGTVDSVAETFTGVDKSLDSIEVILKAIMTEIKRMKGTGQWYDDANGAINTIVAFLDSVMVQNVVDAQYSWDGTDFSITDGSGGPADADALAALRRFGKNTDVLLTRQDGTGGSTTIQSVKDKFSLLKSPPTHLALFQV